MFTKKLRERLDRLEAHVGSTPKQNYSDDYLFGVPVFSWRWHLPQTLTDQIKQLRDDFEELDKKFDDLEKYLRIEHFSKTEKVAVLDEAYENKSEGFRKITKRPKRPVEK
jgi:hypothetical protein